MVRIWKRGPSEKWLARSLLLLDQRQRPVRHPGTAVPSRRQGRVPGLGRAAAFSQARLPQLQGVGMPEEAVFESMNRCCALLQSVAMKLPERSQLDMVEPHVGPEPVIRIGWRALPAFRRSRWRKGVLRGEVRLAEKCSRITNCGQCCGHTLLAHCRIEIDSVVPDAMG